MTTATKEQQDAELLAAQAEFDAAQKAKDVAAEEYFGPRNRWEAATARLFRADAKLKALKRGGRI